MVSIIQKDTDKKGVLRGTALAVPRKDIGTARLKKIIADMKAAIASQDDAVAIAAPQIGHPLRLFVVSKKAFEAAGKEDAEDRVFINPVITKRSRKKTHADEGCLSIRPFYGLVERAEKATIQALDEHGTSFTYGASGLIAQIFQHEIDHLDGILFTDKATKTWEYHPEEAKHDRTKKRNSRGES